MTDTPPNPERRENKEVRRLLAASGRTQEEAAAYLSRRLGRDVRHYHLSRMANGQRRVTADEMDALRELAAQPTGEVPAAPQLTDTADVIPLFGYANGAGQTLKINEDQRVGVVPIHPAQKGSRSAFAFIVAGDSMSPRLNNGEIGYAIRNRTPFRGQVCVVEMNTGEALVKFYDHQDERTLFLSQLQPKPSELTVPLRDVAAVHAVVGVSFGPG